MTPTHPPVLTVPRRVGICPICTGPLWCQVVELEETGRVLEVSTYCAEAVEFDYEPEHDEIGKDFETEWESVLDRVANWAGTQRLKLESLNL